MNEGVKISPIRPWMTFGKIVVWRPRLQWGPYWDLSIEAPGHDWYSVTQTPPCHDTPMQRAMWWRGQIRFHVQKYRTQVLGVGR